MTGIEKALLKALVAGAIENCRQVLIKKEFGNASENAYSILLNLLCKTANSVDEIEVEEC